MGLPIYTENFAFQRDRTEHPSGPYPKTKEVFIMGSLRSLRRKDEIRLTPTPAQLQEQLYNAVDYGTIAEVKALLEAGADPNGWEQAGLTPLATACIEGMIGKVRILLKHGADVNQMCSGGYSPIVCALWGGSQKGLRILEILLDRGGDVNSRSPRRKETPLHVAVRKRNVRGVELLLERGADVTASDGEGRSTLDLVEDNDSWPGIKIKELLLKKSA